MQRHADEGARIIDRLGFLNDAVPAIRHHHERFDGAGYPDGLKGEEIPLGARIIHVADALDSMLTTRIYRAARPASEALDELRRAAGTQFCPRCVAALERILPIEGIDGEDAAPASPGRVLVGHAFNRLQTLARSLRMGEIALSLLEKQMPRRPQYRALAGIDRKALEAFQAGIRKRYTDEQILAELSACAKRLARSPTMREFAADPETSVHPQTVIEHFGSWNEAKRTAGLVPRRFATREELLELLKGLGEELGRIPTARDIEEHRGRMPSKSLYWHTFGSLANALREAGFDVPVGEEKLERALEQGMELAKTLGRLPKFADWSEARKRDETMLTEWQIYRMFEGRKGAWSTFQFLVRERLAGSGTDVASDGTIEQAGERGERREALETERAFLRRAHGRELDSSKSRSGLKRSFSSTSPSATTVSVPSPTSRLRSFRRQEPLGDFERGPGRGEQELVAALADPERPADAARQEERARAPLVEPGGRHRAAELLQGARSALVSLGERRRWPPSRPSSPVRHARSHAFPSARRR